MTGERVIAVGAPPMFRQQVARAVGSAPETVEWMPTVTAAEEFLSAGKTVADVLVLSPSVKAEDAIGFGEFVTRHFPGTAVVLIRDRSPDGALPALIRSGIRDVVDLTHGGDDLREALQRALNWSSSLRSANGRSHVDVGGPSGRVVCVFSSKGGTGKTFLACNLATAVARLSGEPTALVDLDLDTGDVFDYFGKQPTRPLQDLLSVGADADSDTIRGLGNPLDEHLWGYAAPHDPGAGESVSGEAMGAALRTLRDSFAYTILDGTAGYADHVLAAMDLSDAIYLVSGPDVVGLKHLALAIQTLTALGTPRERLRVVLNRSDSRVGLSPADVERVLRIKVDVLVPSSALVPTSLNRGSPVVTLEPRSGVARAVEGVASVLVAESSSMNGAVRNSDPRRRRLLSRR
jgi:pilus assembly protein CpaE